MAKPLLWHPGAQRVIIATAPQDLRSTGGGDKICWHTTEGSSIEGAVAAYRASGVCPTFTIQVTAGRRILYQHLPLNRMASALRHPAGTLPTNTANTTQIEIVGFASNSGHWPNDMYHYLSLLAKWIVKHKGGNLSYDKISWGNPRRMTQLEWVSYTGQCGHVHAPGNDHTDPGRGFHPGKIVNTPPNARR